MVDNNTNNNGNNEAAVNATKTANFVPIYGTEKAVGNIPIEHGHMYMTKEGTLYYDNYKGERVIIAQKNKDSQQVIFKQNTPSSEWVIVHTLNKFPSVTIVDSAGCVIVGDVEYVNNSTIIVRFTSPFSGKAYLN